MDRFHPLPIKVVQRDTDQAVILEFAVPLELKEAFSFVQGQYVTLRKRFGEESVRRCYSICSGVADGTIRVGVKEVPEGIFSTYANRTLRPGDVLEVMPPAGRFHTPLAPEEARAYAAFAVGSGITPILSHIRTILSAEPLSTFTLYYGNRTRATTMFRSELDELAQTHAGRFHLRYYLTQEVGTSERSGRLESKECRRVFDSEIMTSSLHAVFVCGPAQMINDCRDAALAAGLDPARFHSEMFAAPENGNTSTVESQEVDCAEVQILLEGRTFTIQTSGNGDTLLDAALDAGLDAPHSCCRGICDTCRALVREGRVIMRANHVLSDEQVQEGYVLACQSVAASARVVLDFDFGASR